MKRTFCWILLLVLGSACLDEPDCYQLNNNIVTIAFKVLGKSADEIPFNGISAAGTDSVFFKNTKASKIQLPLNVLDERSHFNINSAYGSNTFLLGYNRQIQFVSAECGERYIYSDLKVISHDFDSVRILNSRPSPDAPTFPVTHIEFYRCPRPNLAGVQIKNASGAVVATFYATMSKDATNTTLEFEVENTRKKIILQYTHELKTVTSFCGEQVFFDDLKVLQSDFSNYSIPKDSLEDPPVINLEITQ